MKLVVIGGCFVGALALSGSSPLSTAAGADASTAPGATAPPAGAPGDYVGSETCKQCHEDQFASFSHTTHAKLANSHDANGKMQGCESCHGPGKAHVDAGGDKSKIFTFAGKSPKEISETCLSCHAGREEHNNYRRGEHWRNDIGCTDCHSPHPGPAPETREASNVLFGPASAQKPDIAEVKQLKDSEPQLCLKCHTEMTAQFTQPFHHKVLEGAMKCSDCHNPHGGFDQKQTRLSSGADAVCLKCHTDKQGPFVFEHAPLKTEGCVACHSPHGSANPKMLQRAEVRQLCIECHSNLADIGAPNTPSFHNQASPEFQNCTLCHTHIHGSQSSPVFFH